MSRTVSLQVINLSKYDVRHCHLSEVFLVFSVPFMATVFNDAAQSQAQVTAGGLPAVGFNLMFTQVPCGEAGKNTATFPQ